MITIDGVGWDVPCDIKRVSEVRPSEISGLMLDRSYFNDVIGTYLRFDVTLAVPTSMARQYADLYEILTQPVDGHTFIMPYNEGTIEVTARVEDVQDVYVYSTSRKQYWRGIEFSVLANHPSKSMELGEVLARGLAALPEVSSIPVGTMYEATTSGWVEVEYEDADGKEY
jgi:hypothetical protein